MVTLNGTGTHIIGVSVRLMQDENDETLKWPFNSVITIQLLNWRDDKGHVEKTIGHYNGQLKSHTRVKQGDTAPSGQGKPDFISENQGHS